MEKQIVYIQGKVDRIDERLDNIDKTLAVNTRLLDDHIKRTNLLEDKMGHVDKHVYTVQTAGKIALWVLGVIGSAIGLIAGYLHG